MKPIVILLIAVATAAFVRTGVAQHTHDHETATLLQTPESIKLEHEAIHQELSGLLKGGGSIGTAAKAVAEALHKHFEAEEQFAMPQLGALVAVSQNQTIEERAEVIRLSSELRRHLPEMLAEHKIIKQRVRALRDAAVAEKRADAIAFADKLALHAQNEEEVLYPAGLMVGELLTLRQRSK